MNAKRIFTTLVVAASVGWLSAGSCQVSYCDEDCDPCFQQCRCKTSVCYQSSASFLVAHTLVAFDRTDEMNSAGELHRVFSDIAGLSAQRAGAPSNPDGAAIIAFARGVLAVNAALFGRAANEFELLHTERMETGCFVQFERAEGAHATDLVTFYFDPRGNLVEIAHDARA
ncbi:MAG: hypothetical protein SGI72_11250 [Planctomycetota bacterium]|nr:hypothetical protein [Planctomycetota bacterium]